MTAPPEPTVPPAAAPAVVRISAPADLLDAVPHLVGFVPSESLVLLSLRRPRLRVGLVIRADLPDLTADPSALDRLVVPLVRDGATALIAVVWTARPHTAGLPFGTLVEQLQAVAAAADLMVRDVLCTDGRRWWSYGCRGSCCPPEGTPLPAPGHSVLAAAGAVNGRVVRADRSALADLLAAPPPAEAQAARRRLEAAERRRARVPRDATGSGSGSGSGRAQQERVIALFAGAAAARSRLDDEVAAELLTALSDVAVRDALALSVTDEQLPDAVDLLCAVLRGAVAPWDQAPAALLALLAWRQGSGALANLALERVFASDPDCRLAQLVATALQAGVRPGELFGGGVHVEGVAGGGRTGRAGPVTPLAAPSTRRQGRAGSPPP